MKQDFETWRETARQYCLQLSFARQQVKKYTHLLQTQQEPGNLPGVLEKWQKLQAATEQRIQLHKERGQRWKYSEDSILAVLATALAETV